MLPPARLGALIALTITTSAPAQTFVDLDFSQSVQGTDAQYPNGSTLGPDYYSGLTYDFLNVAFVDGFAVDARVTAMVGSNRYGDGAYEFVGWLPEFGGTPENPGNDLGFYYRFDGNPAGNVGGVRFIMTFYEGGGSFANERSLSDFRFLIYDHDGESTQSESIRLHDADGFVGFRILEESGISHHREDGSVRFDARGLNHPETAPEGGFIAYFQNTSSVRFDMLSTTTGGAPFTFGIFTGFDGDLSLTNGDLTGFGPYMAIPEPTAPLLAAVAAVAFAARRRR